MQLKKESWMLLGLMIYHFVMWWISFINYNDVSQIGVIFENFLLMVDAIIIVYFVWSQKKVLWSLATLLFATFSFAHPFDPLSIQMGLIISLVILFVGCLSYLVYFHKKLRFDILSIGWIFLFTATLLGGIGNRYLYSINQFFGILLIGGVLLFFYLFFKNYKEAPSFKEICILFTILGLFLVGQEIVSFLCERSIVEVLTKKSLSVGWGKSNNIGLMYLLCIPFPLYLTIQSEKRNAKCLFLTIFCFISSGLFFTLSRGAIAIYLCFCPFAIFYLFYKNKKESKSLLLTLSANICFFMIFLTMIYLSNNQFYTTIYRQLIEGVHLDSLNGRIKIYQTYLDLSLKKPIFGYGLFYPFIERVDVVEGAYQWAHSTILHCLFTMGFLGVFAIGFHLFQKYYYLLKRINLKKVTLLCAFALSGCYGLFDVSYFFMPYMVVIFILLLLNKELYFCPDFIKENKDILKTGINE